MKTKIISLFYVLLKYQNCNIKTDQSSLLNEIESIPYRTFKIRINTRYVTTLKTHSQTI